MGQCKGEVMSQFIKCVEDEQLWHESYVKSAFILERTRGNLATMYNRSEKTTISGKRFY